MKWFNYINVKENEHFFSFLELNEIREYILQIFEIKMKRKKEKGSESQVNKDI